MSSHGSRIAGPIIVLALLACSLSPLFIIAEPVSARLNGTDPLNANQELMSGRAGSIVFYGDTGQLTRWNYGTGTTDTVALTGTTMNSLDISKDNTMVAVGGGNSIDIISLPALTVTKTIATAEHVLSVRFGTGDDLYVTYEEADRIDYYSVSAGVVQHSATVGYTSVLETNTDKTVLLAISSGSSADTRIMMYGIAPGSAPAHSLTSSSFGGKLAQAAATNEVIYLACTNAAGVQAISLSDLTLISTLPMEQYPSGVALSRDGKVVFGASSNGAYPSGLAAIYAFEASTGTRLSTRYVNYTAGPLASSDRDHAVVTSFPLRVETIGPAISPVAPVDASVYTYTPAYVRFNVVNNPVVEISDLTATIDSVAFPVAGISSGTYQVNLTGPLGTGTHGVVVTAKWGSMEVRGGWAFSTGSTVPSALRPVLSLIDPVPDSSTNITPDRIVLSVAGSPPPISADVGITLDNLTLTAVRDVSDPTRFLVPLPSGLDLLGVNDLTARAEGEGFNLSGSWTFTITDDVPSIEYKVVTYGGNFSIPAPVSWPVQTDFNGNELIIIGPTYDGTRTDVFVDIAREASVENSYAYIDGFANRTLDDLIGGGTAAEMVGGVNHTAISNLTAGAWKIRHTESGVQEAYALIVDGVNHDRWLIRCSASDTRFIDLWPIFEHMISGVSIEGAGSNPVDVPPSTQGYAFYRMLDDYQMMVPDNWTIKRTAATVSEPASLKLTGPKVGDLHVTILLQNGTDGAVQDDRAVLIALVESQFLPDLRSQGIPAELFEDPRILSISNHTAIVFSIKWTDLANDISLVRQVYYIVDEGTHQYWKFTCEAPEEAYLAYQPIFDKVAQSFSLISKDAASGGGGFFSDPGTVMIIAVLAVTAAVAAIVFLIGMRYRRRV
ncbi:MAG: hypothetical protein ISF22_08755 [Methanomassiliicoccus sp.]|nr:hypothetical protein [Methanomassiliicoccus sp.]